MCFLSYSWANSRDAQSKGSYCPPEALGWSDPRDIKNYLESNGVTCWLDIEQTASVCVCVCVCMRVCVRARACVRVCVRACVS